MNNDWRNIVNGNVIPTVNYCDQPYVVKAGDGAWLCCVTTGSGGEGDKGQHIATMRSFDCGKTWIDIAKVEPDCTFENSYSALLATPSGRLFIFYNHNSDNIREALFHNGKETFKRVDSLGHFVYKYSDDNGKSWSRKRYDVPFRLFRCDRENIYGGKLCFFWNVGHAFLHEGSAYITLNKIGRMGEGFFEQDEGCLFRSPDLCSVEDPGKASWETLPDGDIGIRAPADAGPVAEEHNVIVLSDGSFYDTFRTHDGYSCEAYSRDGGHTWPVQRWMIDHSGRRVKHPRAANFAWKCSNGNYLFWFHNQGGKNFTDIGNAWFGRNPVWILPGVEKDSPEGRMISWGEPEILLYHDDIGKGMSYPDFIEQDGRFFFTETEKSTARTHEIPADFLNRMWQVLKGEKIIPNAQKLLEINHFPNEIPSPGFPESGFTLELRLNEFKPGILISAMKQDGRGIRLEISSERRLLLTMNDGSQECLCAGETLSSGSRIAICVDCGPRIVKFTVDGRLLDGGEELQFGWRRFSPTLTFRYRRCDAPWKLSENLSYFTLWNAPLTTAETVSLTRD